MCSANHFSLNKTPAILLTFSYKKTLRIWYMFYKTSSELYELWCALNINNDYCALIRSAWEKGVSLCCSHIVPMEEERKKILQPLNFTSKQSSRIHSHTDHALDGMHGAQKHHSIFKYFISFSFKHFWAILNSIKRHTQIASEKKGLFYSSDCSVKVNTDTLLCVFY